MGRFQELVLSLHSKNWSSVADLKEPRDGTFVSAFKMFLSSDDCPQFVKSQVFRAQHSSDAVYQRFHDVRLQSNPGSADELDPECVLVEDDPFGLGGAELAVDFDDNREGTFHRAWTNW
jgi:hypothetical protein